MFCYPNFNFFIVFPHTYLVYMLKWFEQQLGLYRFISYFTLVKERRIRNKLGLDFNILIFKRQLNGTLTLQKHYKIVKENYSRDKQCIEISVWISFKIMTHRLKLLYHLHVYLVLKLCYIIDLSCLFLFFILVQF